MRAAWIAVLVLAACGGESATEHVDEAASPDVACSTAADCGPVPVPECASWACQSNLCVYLPKPARTPIAAQKTGDCSYAGCDGAGYVTQWFDASDFVSDGNPCTDDYCDGYTAVNQPYPQGTSCGDGLACSAGAACVSVCKDGVKDGNETDVDCGGGWPCGPCAGGKHCTAHGDCISFSCVAGFCAP